MNGCFLILITVWPFVSTERQQLSFVKLIIFIIFGLAWWYIFSLGFVYGFLVTPHSHCFYLLLCAPSGPQLKALFKLLYVFSFKNCIHFCSSKHSLYSLYVILKNIHYIYPSLLNFFFLAPTLNIQIPAEKRQSHC
jgi:hypothetical protein